MNEEETGEFLRRKGLRKTGANSIEENPREPADQSQRVARVRWRENSHRRTPSKPPQSLLRVTPKTPKKQTPVREQKMELDEKHTEPRRLLIDMTDDDEEEKVPAQRESERKRELWKMSQSHPNPHSKNKFRLWSRDRRGKCDPD